MVPRLRWCSLLMLVLACGVAVAATSLVLNAQNAAKPDGRAPQGRYATENAIIIVMDGTHLARTFGDPEHTLIPRVWNELRPQGTLYTSFYNNNVTITRAGHSQIASGTWQMMRNRGPRSTMPALYEYARDELKLTPEQVWIVFGKPAYSYAPNSSFPGYRDLVVRSEIGLGEESQEDDDKVYAKVVDVMRENHPRLVFANFGATDHMAHSGVWEDHIAAVRHQDELFARLWNEIQQNPAYRDKTALFITNDHGYHDDGVYEGFAEHGDSCEGCRRIMLLALGPDFRKGLVVERPTYQIDIAPTIGELLGFQTPLAQGEVMKEALVAYLGLNRKEARTELAKRAVTINEYANGEVVKTLASRAVKQTTASTAPSSDTTMLLWGLLSAYDKLGDATYLKAVRAWADSHLSDGRSPYAGLVLAQLAMRLHDPRDREPYRAPLTTWADNASAELQNKGSGLTASEFAYRAIGVATAGEVLKKVDLWRAAMTATVARARASQREKAQSTVDDAWMLLALAHVRSHGTGFKGETISDVPLLREESLLQTYLVTDDVEPGELWPDRLQSAVNVAAIVELRRRLDLFEGVPATATMLTWNDICRVRPRTEPPPTLPGIDKAVKDIQQRITETMIGKIARLNYNVAYGFPRLVDFDWSRDELRYAAEHAEGDLLVGAMLLALENRRLIPNQPRVPALRVMTPPTVYHSAAVGYVFGRYPGPRTTIPGRASVMRP
jgi:Metalloenzyme superfamily